MACYLFNRSPRATLDGKIIEKVWTGSPVDYSGLGVFVCPTMCTFLIKRDQSLMRSLDSVSF